MRLEAEILVLRRQLNVLRRKDEHEVKTRKCGLRIARISRLAYIANSAEGGNRASVGRHDVPRTKQLQVELDAIV